MVRSQALVSSRVEIFTTSLQTIDKIVVQIGEHDVETLFWSHRICSMSLRYYER
jgi:hypothetical protein